MLKLKNWNLFEIMWIVISISVAILVSILSKSTILGFSTFLTGMIGAILTAKGKMIMYAFAIYNSIAYAYVCYQAGLYGNTIFQIIFFLPLLIMGLIKWKKNMNKENNTVKMKQMTAKNLTITISICALTIVILGFILSKIHSQNTPYLDAYTNIINLVAILLSSLRYKEQWTFFFVLDIVALIMWILRLIDGNIEAPTMIVLFSAYIINCIYGFVNWSRGSKK